IRTLSWSRRAPLALSSAPSFPRVEPTFLHPTVDTERIELGELVQKSRLRRGRDGDASIAQEDRLAQLQIPLAQGQPLPLEGGQRESGTFEKIERLRRIGRMLVRRRLADHARPHPGLPVARRRSA